jgi:osmotically-inducible protein OsmY
MKTADYVEKIQKAINEDPEIRDKTHISVSSEKRGIGKRDEIHLIGKVSSAHDKERALDIARSNTAEKMEVVDELILVEEKV